MRLTSLSESQSGIVVAYHVTNSSNIPNIRAHGLQKSKDTKYDHVGDGIYLFFDKNRAYDIADYIGLEIDPALITIQVRKEDLLMDEDSLIVDDPDDIEKLRQILPIKALREYMRFLDDNDGDILPIEDRNVAIFKTDLIDRYKIGPSPLFLTEWGHYSVQTARLPSNASKLVSIEVMDQ